jgi:hypothetical protein
MTKRLVDGYQATLRHADSTRVRSEQLHSKGMLLERDLHAVYEGLFLRSVVGFENLLEQVFYAVLTSKVAIKGWQSKIKGSPNSLKACLIEDRDYLDWLPIKRTVDRANIYLRSGRPFTFIDDGEKSQLAQVVAIRNAIAHPSDSALEKFRRQVIGNTPLPPRERKPAAFLRGFARPNVRRYEIYVQCLGKIANRFV